jgi:hypothetical protein
MLHDPIQTAIQPVFTRHREVGFQQCIHRAFHKPVPVHPELTAWLQQPVHHQQTQNFLPTDFFRPTGNRSCQNSLKPSRRHSSLASQQLPNGRGLRSSRPARFTCKLSTKSTEPTPKGPPVRRRWKASTFCHECVQTRSYGTEPDAPAQRNGGIHRPTAALLSDLKPKTEPERQLAQKIIDDHFRLNRLAGVEKTCSTSA